MNMTPKQTVSYLDEYVIGQDNAKKTIAIALRTRYRRMQLDEAMQDEVMPKNILMIGSTGVGKTEIARRLAKLMNLPFIKVEASKYTEVGFVGRDVESMIRDLVMTSIDIVKKEHQAKSIEQIGNYVLDKIVDKLLPPLPLMASAQKKEEYKTSREKIQDYQKFQENFLAIIPVSVAKGGIGFESLLDETVKHLPVSPYLYDPEDLTTEMLRDIYKEFIREAIFDNISDEIPYETDVLIDKVEEGKTLEKIRATIIVEKQTQKGIIIGKGGAAIKRIGKDSRLQIENLIGKKVFLDLFVSVKKGWTNDKQSLEDIGYKF